MTQWTRPAADPVAAGRSHARADRELSAAGRAGASPAPLHDPHGNRVARVTFKAGQAVSELDVLVELAVEINAINPCAFFIDDRAHKCRSSIPTGRVGIAP